VAAARRVRSLGSSVVAVEGCAAESGLGGKVVGYGTVVGAWVAAGGINSADDGARGGRRCVIGAMAAVDAVSFDVLSKNSSSTERTGRSGCRLSVLLGMVGWLGSIGGGGVCRCFSQSKRAVSSTSCDRYSNGSLTTADERLSCRVGDLSSKVGEG